AGDRFGDSRRLRGIELRRLAVRHGAVGTGARADIAQNHERRGAMVPAFADVRAPRILTHGVQLQVVHDALETDVVLRPGRTDLEPGGLRLARAHELQRGFDGHAPVSVPDVRDVTLRHGYNRRDA